MPKEHVNNVQKNFNNNKNAKKNPSPFESIYGIQHQQTNQPIEQKNNSLLGANISNQPKSNMMPTGAQANHAKSSHTQGAQDIMSNKAENKSTQAVSPQKNNVAPVQNQAQAKQATQASPASAKQATPAAQATSTSNSAVKQTATAGDNANAKVNAEKQSTTTQAVPTKNVASTPQNNVQANIGAEPMKQEKTNVQADSIKHENSETNKHPSEQSSEKSTEQSAPTMPEGVGHLSPSEVDFIPPLLRNAFKGKKHFATVFIYWLSWSW